MLVWQVCLHDRGCYKQCYQHEIPAFSTGPLYQDMISFMALAMGKMELRTRIFIELGALPRSNTLLKITERFAQSWLRGLISGLEICVGFDLKAQVRLEIPLELHTMYQFQVTLEVHIKVEVGIFLAVGY